LPQESNCFWVEAVPLKVTELGLHPLTLFFEPALPDANQTQLLIKDRFAYVAVPGQSERSGLGVTLFL
jgi:hypothetical protein